VGSCPPARTYNPRPRPTPARTAGSDDPTSGSGGRGGGKADDVTSDCPVDLDPDKILEAIEGGGNCYTASGIAESCAFGSSLDVQFVAAATDVCAAGFDALPSGLRLIYDDLVERCGAKYASEMGTLYRSAAAFCQLEVTTLFAALYPASEMPEPVVAYTAPECPFDLSDADAITSAIADAGSCQASSETAERCMWGSSIDLGFTSEASAACTTHELSAEDQATRDRLYAACEDRNTEGGTLGRSIVAYCALHVDVIFDSPYSPVE